MILFGMKAYDDKIANARSRLSKNEKLKAVSPMNKRIEKIPRASDSVIRILEHWVKSPILL
jgi:hypothetical protein